MAHDNPPGDAKRREVPAKSNMVLVHGLGVDHRMWNRQLPRLAESYHVFAPDLPGFGDEPPILFTGGGAVEMMADWLAAKIEAEFRGEAMVVGYSMGATVAVALAARRPELVGRLALVAGVTRWGGGLRTLAARFPALTAKLLKARAIGELSSLLGDESDRSLVRDMFSKADGGVMATLLAQLLTTDFGPMARAVRCPVLIVSGGRDPLADADRVKEMKSSLSCGDFIETPGGRHYFCLTHATKLTEALLNFGAGRKSDGA